MFMCRINYLYIHYFHGIYVAYSFMRYIIINVYDGSVWVISFLGKQPKQIEDRKYNIIDDEDYLVISYEINST